MIFFKGLFHTLHVLKTTLLRNFSFCFLAKFQCNKINHVLVCLVTSKMSQSIQTLQVSMILSDKACHQGVQGRSYSAHIWEELY